MWDQFFIFCFVSFILCFAFFSYNKKIKKSLHVISSCVGSGKKWILAQTNFLAGTKVAESEEKKYIPQRGNPTELLHQEPSLEKTSAHGKIEKKRRPMGPPSLRLKE